MSYFTFFGLMYNLLTLSCCLDHSNFNVLYLKISGDPCWIFAQPFLYIVKRIGKYNCLKYKAVKSSCPFSSHLRHDWDNVSVYLIQPLRGQKLLPLFIHNFSLPPLSICGLIWPLLDSKVFSVGSETACTGYSRIEISMTCVRYGRCSIRGDGQERATANDKNCAMWHLVNYL